MNANEMMMRVAWLYSTGHMKQTDIAKIFGVSASYINKLIGQAHKLETIYVRIDKQVEKCLRLEAILREKFPSLQICHVVPDAFVEDDSISFEMVGATAAKLIQEYFLKNPEMIVGISKGRSISSFVKNYFPEPLEDMRFVSIVGNLSSSLEFEKGHSVHELVKKTNSTGYFLPTPYICSSDEEKNIFLRQSSVSKLLKLAKKADCYILGLGCLFDTDGLILQEKYLDKKDLNILIKNNVVGDLAGNFLDTNGKIVETDFNSRTICLSLDDLRNKRVFALVGGGNKGKFILPALETGIITDLIVSEKSVVSALGLEEKI